VEQVKDLISEIERVRFWGNIQLDFQGGRLVLIRKTETIKPVENNSHEAHTRP
jgi:hypothetical protein